MNQEDTALFDDECLVRYIKSSLPITRNCVYWLKMLRSSVNGREGSSPSG
jgi:hypothetical protein